MTDADLEHRLRLLKQRLNSAYDGIGHSYGRPFVYFVYPPERELVFRHMIKNEFYTTPTLAFHHLDVLPIVMKQTSGQEQQREALLADPGKGPSAATSLLRIWARGIGKEITRTVEHHTKEERPVVVLYGLAALHPLGTPTTMMEALAEVEPRHPTTNQIVPIVLCVPGVRPPQTSRLYWFLGQERLQQDFYRGEEA